MKKLLKKILFPVMMLSVCSVFTACMDDDDPTPQYETVKIEQEISRVAVPLKDNEGILTNPNMGVEAWMCNSAEQVKATLSEAFLKKYPEILDVDFTKSTVVFYRTLVLNYSQLDKVDYGFYRCVAKRDEPGYGTYRVNSTLMYNNNNNWAIDDDDSYIMQIAFTVPRIPIAAPVTVNEGVQSLAR
ncbi:MAG: hypothetical protein K2L81_00025 [Muribaculaceae bacterium]|nr:hypothetical protein [Muribaculaceae bacterium]